MMNQFDPKHYRFPRTAREAGLDDVPPLDKHIDRKVFAAAVLLALIALLLS